MSHLQSYHEALVNGNKKERNQDLKNMFCVYALFGLGFVFFFIPQFLL